MNRNKGRIPAVTADRKQRKVRPAKIAIFTIFTLSLGLYLIGRIFLNTVNADLSKQNNELTEEITALSEDINFLQSEVNTLQDKASVLGMLDNQVSDNQNNVVVINEN